MAEEAVEKYLKSTNRPYSANDIVQNMHKQWGKTGVQRALDNLVASQVVIEKCYGKQKVYAIKQDPNDCPTEEELKELDVKIEEANKELNDHLTRQKALELEIKSLESGKSKKQIIEEIKVLNDEIEELQTKLDKLSSNNIPISPGKITKLKENNEIVSKEYRKRKRICMDMVNTVLETYPKSKKALLEEVGLETDEDVEYTFENVQI